MTVLIDSCSVIKFRDSNNGFENKPCESVAPALIDIDSDSHHHIHNACEKTANIFNKYLEKLYQDIYNDFKWSEDK